MAVEITTLAEHIDGAIAASKGVHLFLTLSTLLASTEALAEGDRAFTFERGQSYEVAASGAADHHLARANGTKLYVLPGDDGRWNGAAFGLHPDPEDTTDDTAAIQMAISAAETNGGGIITYPTGIYHITELTHSPFVTLQGTGVYMRGGAKTYTVGTVFKALAGSTVMIDASGDPYVDVNDTGDYLRSGGFFGIFLDGANIAQVGIKITETVQPHIRMCGFVGFVAGADDGNGGTLAGGAAIYGGGVLYNIIEQNSFSPGDYYAIYLQEALKTNPDLYYGANHGVIRDNAIHARYGIVHEGIQDVYGNAFEMVLKGDAALHITGTDSRTYSAIWGNYFELYAEQLTSDPDTFNTLCAIKARQANGGIFCNRIYGDGRTWDTAGSGVAIDLSGTNYGLSVWGNEIERWDEGIALAFYNGGSADATVNNTDIRANHFGANVTTKVSNGPTVARTINDDSLTFPLIDIKDVQHTSRAGGTYLGAAILGTTTAVSTLNLRWGNAFRFDHASQGSAVTVDTVLNASPGSIFTVTAAAAGKTILADSAFNLACGANFTLPVDVPLIFETSADGTVREVGRTSALHTVVSHDFGSGTEDAVEVSPGVFVRADVV